KAMKQCLERSSFDYDTDRLIQLGDIADGQDQVYECVEELLTIKNLVALKGNHDEWFFEFMQSGYHPDQWRQGGAATAKSYLRLIGKETLIQRSGEGYKTALNPGDIPETHQNFFRQQHLYYIDESNNCFVHAGFDRHQPFRGQRLENYFWDRTLWMAALSFREKIRVGRKNKFNILTPFNEIFIGHTSTIQWKTDQPMHAANIWNLDTGGGHGGRLTIMEAESKTYWQSDPIHSITE
ncbi:MAG: metallophosphoesterase, partial [Bacteroidota bacterium]|nr:metallophosphoesterase [Bacteroidota bacterium]